MRAARIERYDALVLGEHPTKPDDAIAAGLLADAWKARSPRAADEQLLRRLAFAGRSVDVDELVRLAARDARALDDVQLARALPPDVLRALDREAPAMLAVPSGRSVPLEYSADGGVSAAVKLQEVFGLAETPRLGPAARARPVLAAGAEWTARPTDPRSPQLLGPHLSGGSEGAARPVPEASVARGSVEREAERPSEAT